MSMETSDLKTFTSTFLRDDVIFHFTNLPPLKGYEGVASVFGIMGGLVTKMKHAYVDYHSPRAMIDAVLYVAYMMVR